MSDVCRTGEDGGQTLGRPLSAEANRSRPKRPDPSNQRQAPRSQSRSADRLRHAFFLIADIDSPRGGLVKILPQNLNRLATSLRLATCLNAP